MGMPGRATAEPRRPLSWSDFVALPEDDLRELIDGELVEVEVPGPEHEQIVATLIFHLQSWVLPRRAGHVLGSGYKLRVSDDRGVMPDVQLLSNDTWAQRTPGGLEHGRPELVVEVISPTSRRHDRVTKLRWSAGMGVPEYWIVDPEARTLERLVLRDGGYLIAQAASGDDTFRPSSFEGLQVSLAELWADEPPA